MSYAPSVPQGYTGPVARLRDSAEAHSTSKVDYFYVKKIAGGEIKNSRVESLVRNRGRGFYMEPQVLDREIPARSVSVEIVGRTEYAAPILALTNPVYQVAGSTEFTPEADKLYVVKGKLGESYSAVWIEEAATGAVVGQKIEIHGSAKLGILQK